MNNMLVLDGKEKIDKIGDELVMTKPVKVRIIPEELDTRINNIDKQILFLQDQKDKMVSLKNQINVLIKE